MRDDRTEGRVGLLWGDDHGRGDIEFGRKRRHGEEILVGGCLRAEVTISNQPVGHIPGMPNRPRILVVVERWDERAIQVINGLRHA